MIKIKEKKLRIFDRFWLSFKKASQSLTEKQIFWMLFFFVVLLTTLLIYNPFWQPQKSEYKEGDVLRESIISPSDITFVDEKETEARREEARQKVKPIFVFEANKAEKAVQNFKITLESIFEKASKLPNVENSNIGSQSNLVENKNANSSAKSKRNTASITSAILTDAEKVLTSRKFKNTEIEMVLSALRESADGYIYNDSDRQYLKTEVVVLDKQKPFQQSTQSLPETNWISLSQARESLKNKLYQIKSLSEKEKEAFYEIAEQFIQPSVSYDSDATNKALESATQSIAPVVISLKRQQKIASEGDYVNAEILSKIKAIENYTRSTRQWNHFFGLLMLLTALYWIAWKYIENRSPMLKIPISTTNAFALFCSVIIVQVLINITSFQIANFTALQNVKAPLNDATIWALACPFAFTSLSLVLLVDPRIALFSGIFASLLTGFIAPRPLEFVLYSVISSSIGVYGIRHYRSRSSLTTSGMFIGLANSATAIALIAYLQQPFIFDTVLLSVCCAFLGGIVASAATAVLLPLLESAFGILTDVKLLELSNAELPLLKQLAMRAPGTNQHSHVVGQLAEESCRAIGANGLLAKIGALYHDIGKTAAPEHFIENQRGKNPHDKLKPSQSAKIIVSHVTYGMKLAKEHKLPQVIADFIPQHHGTRTLHYFLQKAKSQVSSPREIDENDFRYPGPKPQTKEAAILMIADSCEAAARSLEEPTPENLRFIVTKIIDAILADNQLDECDLTLRELGIVRETIIKSLSAIYHPRIEYPGYVPPSKEESVMYQTSTLPKYSNPEEIPISKGGEIEEEAFEYHQKSAKQGK
jgi:cyclic-di-AMP phosphodiesterase PgpH